MVKQDDYEEGIEERAKESTKKEHAEKEKEDTEQKNTNYNIMNKDGDDFSLKLTGDNMTLRFKQGVTHIQHITENVADRQLRQWNRGQIQVPMDVRQFVSNNKVTVTPHKASETRPITASQVIAMNIKRAENGQKLLYLVDRENGY